MRNRAGLNNLFSRDRKTLYIILSIVMVSVLTLTVVYAALSTTLNINGNAEVTAASWDIYLDNVVLNSNSTTTNVPTITDKTTASFSTTLSKPGDFYEFTIDVVNNGSIDAMINSVTKTPELTDTQKKYLSYVVEYQNGESISTKQLVEKKSFVRLKVKVEYRKDLAASDLPSTSETLNLSFKVNYVQSDDKGNSIINNGVKAYNVVSGDLKTIGSEICIGNECFYLISYNENSVTLLAKYNLYVGGIWDNGWIAYGDEATGLQDSTMYGYGSTPRTGTIIFSSTDYWSSTVSNYPTYVYNSDSNAYHYVENYKLYLENQGAIIEESRLISYDELIELGCSTEDGNCLLAPQWVYTSSYWTGTVRSSSLIWDVLRGGSFYSNTYSNDSACGVRPVIVLSV